MKRVLIVDDEFLVRVGLRSMVDWQANGFEIAGEASTGLEAYRFIREHRPDIVLLDIKMPEMDGLQLMEKLQRDRLSTSVIVLSCHNEFEDVKTAMKLGARDYVMKLSTNSEKLLQIIRNVSVENPAPSPVSVSPRLSEHEWWNLIFRYDLRTWSALFGDHPPLRAGHYFVAVCKIDFFESRMGLRQQADARTYDESVRNLMGAILADYHGGAAFECGVGRFVLLANEDRDAADTLELIRDHLHRYFDFCASIGYKVHTGEPAEIPVVYRDAKYALDCGYVRGPGQLICFAGESSPVIHDPEPERRLLQGVQSADKREVLLALQPVLAGLATHATRIRVLRATGRLLGRLESLLRDMRGAEVGLDAKGLLHRLRAFEFFDDMAAALRMELEALCDQVGEAQKSESGIVQALGYIRTHYRERLDLETLAGRFGLNPSYFSHLFHQTTGKRFVEYLTAVRIEEAKKLLRGTHRSISDIAGLVGYDNIYYLGRCP